MERLGARGRPKAFADRHDQRIVEEFPQAGQPLGGCGLGQEQPGAGARDVAFLHQHHKEPKQVEVEPAGITSDIHGCVSISVQPLSRRSRSLWRAPFPVIAGLLGHIRERLFDQTPAEVDERPQRCRYQTPSEIVEERP
jgi:hypothetical protein